MPNPYNRNTTNLNTPVDPALAEWLKQRARDDGRSTANYVRYILNWWREYVNTQENKDNGL